ncbi:hypothetical protein F5Y19DRAFT_476476 [Xylariaceae sp. FL1651]|nr:hypothetical protein F5Y19DRAFT_476476 [Xylariaceae sp. FL1651]
MSDSVAATITTSSASLPSSTIAPACNLYVIPITDAACAVPYGGNHTDAMSNCCKSADVVSYYDNCGLYCVAAGQSIKDLQDCLFDKGVKYQDVFCNANVNATATNTNPTIPATASASVVASGDSNNGNGNSGGNGGSQSGSPKPSDSKGAAPRLAPELGVSSVGLTIGALLFSAMAFGAFQI